MGLKRLRSRRRRRRTRSLRPYPELEVAQKPRVIPLVVGLGNPGSKYLWTRHNVGFMAADRLLKDIEVIGDGEWPQGHLTFARREHQQFLLLKPLTFMNLSGEAVKPVCGLYRVDVEDILVIHDDIDIPFGDVRKKVGGGSAGHRGVESMILALGEEGFIRVRIGVGRPPVDTDPADYVLTELPLEDMEELSGVLDRALELVLEFLREKGLEAREESRA